MKIAYLTAATAALTLVSSVANAALVTVLGTAPGAVVDPTQDAFYVIETGTSTGGAYEIFNNTTDYELIGFGVSNPAATIAVIDGDPSPDFITESNGSTFQFWQAFSLNAANWDSTSLLSGDFGEATAQSLFGDFAVASAGETTINYFEIFDASPLAAGLSAIDFGFLNGVPASSLIGVASDPNGNVFSFISGTVINPTTPVSAVPIPGGLLLLGTALAGLGVARRRR